MMDWSSWLISTAKGSERYKMCVALKEKPSLTSVESKCVFVNECVMCFLLGYVILVGSSLYRQYIAC